MAKLGTVIIQGVDVELLDKQRLTLTSLETEITLPKKYKDALDGVINMLEVWSDEQYFKKETK